MYFLNNHEHSLSTNGLGGGSIAICTEPQHPLLAALWGEEQPANMLSLLTVLVILLHVAGFVWLERPLEQETPAEPLVMAVEMITMSASKPIAAKPIPSTQPPPAKKPRPIKPKTKPVPHKSEPVIQELPDFAPTAPVAESQPVTQANSTTRSVASASNTPATPPAEHFTEANYKANYAHNPKPEYPAVAKSRNWQGKVILHVQVSAQGLSNSVKVEHSSGHDMLDEAAIEAVKQWRFIPAKRGDTSIASSVLVPIVFRLRD
jgi:periplasmic protein TonB